MPAQAGLYVCKVALNIFVYAFLLTIILRVKKCHLIFSVLDEARINFAATLVQKIRSHKWTDFKSGIFFFLLYVIFSVKFS